MDLHEECGVFGVMADQPENVAGLVYFGLYSLQHRGQESCGIVVNDDGVFVSHKDIGLVGEVFDTYWMFQYEDKLCILDQHAAHEKVKNTAPQYPAAQR